MAPSTLHDFQLRLWHICPRTAIASTLWINTTYKATLSLRITIFCPTTIWLHVFIPNARFLSYMSPELWFLKFGTDFHTKFRNNALNWLLSASIPLPKGVPWILERGDMVYCQEPSLEWCIWETCCQQIDVVSIIPCIIFWVIFLSFLKVAVPLGWVLS